jgi:Spy/CpxP family protein refolding chaperone
MSNPRNRNLLIIIGVLLLTNIGVLVYFLGKKEPSKLPEPQTGKDRPGITEMLQKEVGFNDEQTAKYKLLKEKQKETIRPMYDDMRKMKDSLFRLLSYPETSDSLLNKMADAIAQKQKALDLQTFNHFKRVRILCTPEQQSKYDSMVLRMFRKMGKTTRHNESEKTGNKK